MLTRRQLLKTALVLAPAGTLLPSVFQRALFAAELDGASPKGAAARRTLVVVQLAGGNDGLNTVVSYADGRYYDARPNLGVPQDQILPLNNDVGLHPSLADLMPLWKSGRLAIVEGVGYPNQSYSHFQSMDIWQSADLTGKLREGWLGRYFAQQPPQEGHWFPGLAVGRNLPPSLYNPQVPVPAVASVETYRLQGGSRDPRENEARAQALLSLYAKAPRSTRYAALLHGTLEAAHRSSLALQEAVGAYKPAAEYPNTPFASGLKLLAQALVGDLGVRVGHVSLGGFDTHADQARDHPRLLQTLAQGLAAFYKDLQAHGRDRDTLIMTWSEFGRRVNANASVGTDHGSAAPLFLLGAPVKGGLYGGRPDLGRLDYGNLRFATDFRSVYKTVLEQWLGAPAGTVLGVQGLESIPFLAA